MTLGHSRWICVSQTAAISTMFMKLLPAKITSDTSEHTIRVYTVLTRSTTYTAKSIDFFRNYGQDEQVLSARVN